MPGVAPGFGAVGEAELQGKVSYFIANDPAKWRRDLPIYARVRYTQAYPGVDRVYYGNQRQLDYDFVASLGASAGQIRLQFAGQTRLSLSARGGAICC